MKPALFHPSVKPILRNFPEKIRKEIGKAVLDLQHGAKLTMPLSKSMSSVAAGVEELRMKDAAGIYRVFYFTRSEQGILIFHAFTKKTQKTPNREIELGRKRLKEIKEMAYEND